jgi:hypothetical protein
MCSLEGIIEVATKYEKRLKALVGRVGVEPTVSFRRRIMSPLPATSTASGPEMM